MTVIYHRGSLNSFILYLSLKAVPPILHFGNDEPHFSGTQHYGHRKISATADSVESRANETVFRTSFRNRHVMH